MNLISVTIYHTMLVLTSESIHELFYFNMCGLFSGGKRWSPRVSTCEWAQWVCQPLRSTCPLTSTSTSNRPPVIRASLFAPSPCTPWEVEWKRRAAPHPVSSPHPSPGVTPALNSASPLKLWTSVPPGVKAMIRRGVMVRCHGVLMQASHFLLRSTDFVVIH